MKIPSSSIRALPAGAGPTQTNAAFRAAIPGRARSVGTVKAATASSAPLLRRALIVITTEQATLSLFSTTTAPALHRIMMKGKSTAVRFYAWIARWTTGIFLPDRCRAMPKVILAACAKRKRGNWRFGYFEVSTNYEYILIYEWFTEIRIRIFVTIVSRHSEILNHKS